jgi:hypothetical protein
MTTASTTAGAGTPIHTGTPAFARTGQAAVVAGFSATIASWVVWWLTHLPGLGVPSPAAAALLGLTLVISLACIGSACAQTVQRPPFSGGVIAGALNLLILGSILGEQADSADAMADRREPVPGRRARHHPGLSAGHHPRGRDRGRARGVVPGAPSAAPDGLARAVRRSSSSLSFFPLLFIGGR